MPKFVELWVYLSATPLFGLTATLAVYVLAQALYTRLHQPAWANPVLWSVVVIAGVLLATGVSYPTYFAGAQFIHFLLGPAVVALGWPLWKRRAELRQRWGRLLLAALAGGVAASGSAVALAWAVGLPADVVLSLAPKSVTAPVAMGIAEKIGGIPALAAAFVVICGIFGGLVGPIILRRLGIKSKIAKGLAMGSSSHALGTARAMEMGALEGAISGLAIGIMGIMTALLIPFAEWLF